MRDLTIDQTMRYNIDPAIKDFIYERMRNRRATKIQYGSDPKTCNYSLKNKMNLEFNTDQMQHETYDSAFKPMHCYSAAEEEYTVQRSHLRMAMNFGH